MVAFPLILLLAFSSFPKSSKTEIGDNKEESPKSLSENIELAEKTADLPHAPLLQHSHKDLSLSEKAAVAVAGLVGPGTPKSVFDFRATTIGDFLFIEVRNRVVQYGQIIHFLGRWQRDTSLGIFEQCSSDR
jgi:hypothetical protein